MKKLSLLLLICAIQSSLKAQPGVLDPSFGNNGIFTLNSNFSNEWGSDVAVTSDKKIIMAAKVFTDADYGDQKLIRFLSNGSLDSSFGDDGILIPYDDYDITITALTVDDSDRIVAYVQYDDVGDLRMYVYRYLQDGSIDHSFSNDGKVKTEIYYAKTALLTQPDGKVLIAGTNNDYPYYPGLIQRLNNDGSDDLTFNQTSTLELGNDIVPRAITLDASGRILLAGFMNDKLWAGRLLDNGSYDSSFGINGSITIDGDDYFASQDISVLPNNKIVITGYSSNNLVSDFKCWRFNEDGSPDVSFGDSGLVSLANGDVFTQGWFLLPDSDNSVIAGGTQFNGSDFDPVIFRILDNGSIDQTFGNNGIAGKTFTANESVDLNVVRTNDGKIILCGTQWVNGNAQFALSCFKSNGQIDSSFGSEGNVTMRLLDSVESFYDKALDVSVLDDETILVSGEALEATLFRLTNGQYDDSYGEDGLFVPGRIKSDNPLIASKDSNVYMVHDYTPWSMGLIGMSYTNQSIVNFDYSAFVVYKLLPDGSLDSSFGNSGVVQPNIVSNQFDLCTSIMVQPDGKLLLAGTTRLYINDYIFYDDVYVSRLNMDGSIDSGFGTDGVALLNWTGDDPRFPKMDLLDDGRIIVDDGYSKKIARLLPDGILDAEFGDNGIAYINTNDFDIRVLEAQPDSKTIVAFQNNLNGQNFYLMRLNEDGSTDLSFGDNGCDSLNWMKFNIGFTPPKIIAQPDGKILCVGRSNYLSQGMGITRLNNNGSIDSTFGADGVTKIETSGPLDIFSINLQADGKILVAGEKDLDFFVARFQNDVAVSASEVETPDSFQVYPNPASDQLVVRYPFSLSESSTISISDLMGKILREEKVNSSSDHFAMKVNDLSPGIYLMTLRTERNSVSAKFVKE